MKRTIGLLIALTVGIWYSGMSAEQVQPNATDGVNSEDELVLDDETLNKMDTIEKDVKMSLTEKTYLAYLAIQSMAIELKNKTVNNVKEHKKAYIVGSCAVTSALVMVWWLMHHRNGDSRVFVPPSENK
jgi:hypothetical protein